MEPVPQLDCELPGSFWAYPIAALIVNISPRMKHLRINILISSSSMVPFEAAAKK